MAGSANTPLESQTNADSLPKIGSTLAAHPSLSRRQLLGFGLGIASLTASIPCAGQTQSTARSATPTPPAATPPKRNGLLVRHSDVGELSSRCKLVLELEGQLQLKEPDPSKEEKLRSAEVKAKSTLDYFEKSAYEDSELVATARKYVEAKAENWISGSASSQTLRPDCNETRMMLHNGSWQQYCENETLDQRETELLHSPINSGALEVLLPSEPAKPDSTWTINTTAAKTLFNLDAVHQSSLKAKIAKVENGVATIEIAGKLDATANSVPTTLEIKGNFSAKLASQCAFVTWLGIVIKESREISQSEPGFRITARVRLIREETENQFEITDSALRQLATAKDDGQWLVKLQSPSGRYSMLGDRRWRTYLDNGEEAILRLVENNSIIAQCNISRLPKLSEGSQLTLEGMQADIKASLGESFGQFLEANEKVTSGDLRQLRTVVAGEAENVPIQWIYNHLSDDQGRRVALIYTMGGNVVDRFAAADEQMTASFELQPDAASIVSTPTVAPEPDRSKAEHSATQPATSKKR